MRNLNEAKLIAFKNKPDLGKKVVGDTHENDSTIDTAGRMGCGGGGGNAGDPVITPFWSRGGIVSILLQSSPGIVVATQIPMADGARRVAIGDLNQDGVPELAVVSMVYQDLDAPSRVSVLLQSAASSGQFSAPVVFAGLDSWSFIAVGDMNGDGRNDLVLESGLSVLLQLASVSGTFTVERNLR